MTTDENLSFFEKRILADLEGIEQRLRELTIEKNALIRQLARARAEREGLQFSVRKNSMNRVLAENSVLKSLREKDGELNFNTLYLNAKDTNFDLKESTFRTYLNRMKEKGLIGPSRKYRGHWALPSNIESQ